MDKFLDINHLKKEFNKRLVINKDDEIWLVKTLEDLELKVLNTHQQAKKIQEFVTNLVDFTPNRFKTISEIRESKNGNCYDHALMSLILLRMAGIKAKFARELQLYRRTPETWKEKNFEDDTHWQFGAFHNDHTWILYFADEMASLGFINELFRIYGFLCYSFKRSYTI